MMKVVLVIIFLALTFQFSLTVRIVCYYSSWAVYNREGQAFKPEDIDPYLCTHINYAFVALNPDGSLRATDENIDVKQGGYYRTTDLKKQNPNLKVMLSIGPETAAIYAEVAANADKRAAMVGSARWFIEAFHFDGIDIDWEIPQGVDRDNFVALLQDFRNDFNKNGWIVSAAVNAIPQDGYDIPRISQILDYINLMTYDMYGPDWSEYTGQNSPLYASSIESDWEKNTLNMAASVQYWINSGADPAKLNAGIAFYGHTYTLSDPSNNGLHAPFIRKGKPGPILNTEGAMAYFEICLTQWNCIWDNEQKNPICVNGDQWLGSDNVDSIKEKINFIKSKGLGGAMIWAIDQDDNHGSCGMAKPLLHAVSDNLL